jgi:hypothetical protein
MTLSSAVTSNPKPFAAPTPELAQAALEQKTLSRLNRTKGNVQFCLGMVVGAAASLVAAAYVFRISPTEHEDWYFYGAVLGAGIGAWVASRFRQMRAACPICQHNWKMRHDSQTRSNERMESWETCPGCGLLMADWALQRASEGKPCLRTQVTAQKTSALS